MSAKALAAWPVGLCLCLVSVSCRSSLESMEALQGTRLVRPSVVFQIIRDSPDILVLDLRTPEEFHGQDGHINGAVNVPLEDLDELLRRTKGLGRDQAIVIYCRDQACVDEGQLQMRLHGVRFCFVLEGGLDSWIADGFGTVDQAKNTPEKAPAARR